MSKNLYLIFGGIAVLAIGAGVGLFLTKKPNVNQENIVQNNTPVATLENQQPINTSPKTEAPLPSETDIIRNFFSLINEQKPSEAVMMMPKNITEEDSLKQAWAVQFNAFKSVLVDEITPSMQENWVNDTHTYQVNLTVEMKPEAINVLPIPNYGFDDGSNVRFVALQKEDGLWKITGLATGP